MLSPRADELVALIKTIEGDVSDFMDALDKYDRLVRMDTMVKAFKWGRNEGYDIAYEVFKQRYSQLLEEI